MVTKSPKSRILGKRRFKNPYLRVHVQKLDDNVVKEYQLRLDGLSCSSNSIKEERSCFFSSEIDLNENEHAPSAECSGRCQCNYCSPYREMKLQTYQQYLDAVENQENVVNQYPYLCDVIQENAQQYPYKYSVVQENVQVPPVVEKCDAETQTAPRQYRFTCKDCSSQFNNEYYYDQHIKVHRKLYECAFCDATFFNEKQLQPHILLHMSKNYFECVYCSCIFSNKKHLSKHISCHDKNFFECGECKAKFVTDKGLHNHKKSHVSSGKMIHVFRLAKAVSLSQSQLQPQESPRQLTSVEIMETESANMDLPDEEPQKNVRNFFRCDVCDLHFSDGRKLFQHSIIHKRKAGKCLHFCAVCGARFSRNCYLSTHMRYAHKALK